MPHYDVKVVVEFSGEVHADSKQEAEDYAYSNWSAEGGAQIQYSGVYSTKAVKTKAESEQDNCPSDGCPDLEEEDEEDDD